ncbi:cerebellar degeneration-related protein 2 isoform X2 [Coccinella septempunctata]|uniref:cerebellar degeneration-related protein 2 isoform X2 n=1 Tax=Coccinella septempunctata TaxID=41139 RepID=UPI001D06E852|nr:cerebellar degeneration-related protein 2 isoform X2 [Coccinella septempunctata]
MMATHKQLEDEWRLCLSEDLDDWVGNDLQLAAELGKTLLERNKELENALKHSQNVIDDQTQEIMYLSKQTTALREVNESRLKIYEHLEVSIQDLEIVNHKLNIDYANEKKRTKNLGAMLENMESKNNELLSQIDDLTLQVDMLKKKLGRQTEVQSTPLTSPMYSKSFGNGFGGSQPSSPDKPNAQDKINASTPKADKKTDTNQEPLTSETLEDGTDALEEVSKLLAQLRDVKLMHAKEQRKVTELEEHLDALQQQNQALENQVIKLHHKGDEFKSIHEEISLLEEVRKGQICSRCLTDMEYVDQQSRLDDPEEFEENIPEDDDSSILHEIMNATPPFISKFDLNVDDYKQTPNSKPPSTSKSSKNFYREFVEKYEPLFIDHAKKMPVKKLFASLEEELKNSGEFSSFGHKDQDYESGQDDCSSDKQNGSKKSRKMASRTPTDFSEAETSSSGFADEMSNSSKSTQTDCILGSLLCSISAGEDCSLGVYNIADNQMQQKSQYLELFKEIFTVLKKAAENKDEVLESSRQPDFNEPSMSTTASDTQLSTGVPEVHSDDTASVQSSTISLTVPLPQEKVEDNTEKKQESEEKKEHPKKTKQEKKKIQDKKEKPEKEEAKETKVEVPSSSTSPVASEVPVEESKPQEPVLRPLIRQPFEYIRVEHRKRSSSRRKNRNVERSDSPMTHIIGSQPINYTSRPNSGRRRRELKNAQRNSTPEPSSEMAWNGNTLQFWSSNRASIPSPTPSQSSERGVYEFKPSLASQEIRKLKNLDKSYAEVLKLGESRKRDHHQRHRANKGTTQHR